MIVIICIHDIHTLNRSIQLDYQKAVAIVNSLSEITNIAGIGLDRGFENKFYRIIIYIHIGIQK